MKDFFPEAQFDPFDPPAGDKRWWYKEAYNRHGGLEWKGPEPDIFSPHTGTEEFQIQQAILEGLLEPRNQYEDYHRSQIAEPRPKSEWPVKWVQCKRCKCDYSCTGYPAGKQSKFTNEIKCHQLVDKAGYVWFWPNVCQACADYKDSFKIPKKPKPERKTRSVIKD
jgi:hypothetical protein